MSEAAWMKMGPERSRPEAEKLRRSLYAKDRQLAKHGHAVWAKIEVRPAGDGKYAVFAKERIENPGKETIESVQSKINKLVDEINLKGHSRDRAKRLRELKEKRDRLEGLEVLNPARSAKQYRLAQAVLSGKSSRMPKKVAKELVEATPAKQRSKFMKANHRRKKNFLGLGGKPQLMSSSRLSKDAYNQGYLNKKDFRAWLDSQRKSENMSSGMVKDLERSFDRGRSERLEHEANKQKLALLKEKKADSPKAPAIPKGEKASDQNEEYRGRTIRRTTKGFEVLGTSWNNIKQAKEYVDVYEATGGRAKLKNPLKKLHYSPLHSNASINRQRAAKLLKAGVPPAEIAAQWSAIWNLSDGKLGQKYDSAFDDGSGRLETRYTMLGVDDFLKKWKADKKAKRNPKGVIKSKIAKARKTIEKRVTKAVAVLRGKKNPSYTLTQGRAKGFVVEGDSNQFIAEVIAPDGSKQEHVFKGKGGFKAAASWVRLRLFEVANPVKWKLYPKRTGKRNPEDTSVRMFEKFHGTPSTEVIEFAEEEHRHAWLASMGPLISMKVQSVTTSKVVELEFADPAAAKPGEVVMLCVNEEGNQLICMGGDQELDEAYLISNFGMTPADFNRDNALIGTITEITYRTKKKFEKDGQEEVDFYHELGKEGSHGVLPVLEYKTRSPKLVIVGGRYYIGKAEPSLGNTSPGLIG
jgi:hypothetical protein